MKTRSLAAGALLLLACGARMPAIADDASMRSSTAPVESGELRGRIENDLLVFRGIPYAAPPVGELRWRAPQPVPHWQGAFDASHFSPGCMQILDPPIEMSEDCLTLNVWTPAKTRTKSLPVMVWIHGGGYYSGASSLPVYDGAELAREGVVLVTLNYRLNVFGFFAHSGLNQAGEPHVNFGLLDQIAALRWVQQNIAAFGGDARNVTIFGESAGGGSVLLLLTSPHTQGLFHKAIVESGGGFTRKRQADSTAELRAERTAAGTLVDSVGGSLAAARKRSADDILKAAAAVALKAEDTSRPFRPVVDGEVVRETPGEVFAAGDEARVPLIIGTNSFEGVVYNAYPHVTDFWGTFGFDRDALLPLYRGVGDAKERDKLMFVFGDAYFVAPARFLATQHTKREPTYLYYFDRLPLDKRTMYPGTPHAMEVPFVFGTGGRAQAQKDPSFTVEFDAADKKISAEVRRYWTQFARSGDPNQNGLPSWPRYQRAEDKVLVIDKDIAAKTHPLTTRLNYHEAQLAPR